MTYNPTKPPIYPPYCFDAAPTYNVSSFLKATDISVLQLYRNIPGVHFYGNLPVRWVRIVGVIVGIDDFPGKRVYIIDDSSGLNVQCVLPLDARQESASKVLAPGPLIPPEYSELDVGHVVDLRGPVVPYRRQRAINIRRMKRVPTTQHELLLWERRLKFKTEVIDVPWALSDEEIRGYRRKAGQAATKDLNLAVTKRKRGAQRVDGQGAQRTEDDPFKIRKGGTKPASASSHKESHRSGETLNGTNVPAHSKPVSTSQREAPSQPCGDKLDPYSIKAKKAARPALPAAPRATPSRMSSIHDDPFRVTKEGSRRTFKVPIQSPARPSVEPLPAQENLPSGVNQSNSAPNSRASGGSQVQHPSVDQDLIGRAKSPEPSHKETSTPAPKSKARHAVLAGAADDPYVIKARGSRRASTKPTASEWSTSAGLSKLARPRKGPCSEKSPNSDPMILSKRTYPLARDLKNSQRHGGPGMRFDVDDPFKITKLAGREHSMRL